MRECSAAWLLFALLGCGTPSPHRAPAPPPESPPAPAPSSEPARCVVDRPSLEALRALAVEGMADFEVEPAPAAAALARIEREARLVEATHDGCRIVRMVAPTLASIARAPTACSGDEVGPGTGGGGLSPYPRPIDPPAWLGAAVWLPDGRGGFCEARLTGRGGDLDGSDAVAEVSPCGDAPPTIGLACPEAPRVPFHPFARGEPVALPPTGATGNALLDRALRDLDALVSADPSAQADRAQQPGRPNEELRRRGRVSTVAVGADQLHLVEVHVFAVTRGADRAACGQLELVLTRVYREEGGRPEPVVTPGEPLGAFVRGERYVAIALDQPVELPDDALASEAGVALCGGRDPTGYGTNCVNTVLFDLETQRLLDARAPHRYYAETFDEPALLFGGADCGSGFVGADHRYR